MPTTADPSPVPALARWGRPLKVLLAAVEAPGSPVSLLDAEGADYERERAARIGDNMERMQNLGILDLTQTLNNSTASVGSSGGGT
jgi:hypothetical protein